MRRSLSNLFFGLVGRLTAHVLHGYVRHQLARSRRKLVVAGAAGVAIGAVVAVVLRRGSGPRGGRGGAPPP
jgi:hypothetical protein